MTDSLLTLSQINQLRRVYSGITKIDPDGEAYGHLCETLDAMEDAHLSQISVSNISFVSSLARNRCIRRGI